MKKRVLCSALLLSLSLVSGLAAQPVNETNQITDMSEPVIISERVISGEEQPEEIFSSAVDELSAETAAQEGESARSYGYIPYTGPLENPILGSKEGIVKAVSYPEKFDSRTNATVTSVKNQYQTGSCWAHATMAASESSLIKSKMATDSLDLSEFQLAFFYYDKPFDALGNISDDLMSITPNTAASKLNMGGNAVSAMWHLATWSGPVAESEAPSITNTSHTDTTSILASSLRNTSLYHIKESKVVAFEKENKDAIKQLIMQYGGVTASYYYASGWEKEVGDTITYYNPSKTSSNHAVEIVGWDDTYPVANFLGSDYGYTPSCPGAWLCKNSWGTGSGRGDGYFWMSYDTTVYYADCVAFSYEDSSLYQNIYQYDGSIYSSSLLTSDDYVMNVYTAKGNPGGFEKIDAVGLGTGANGTYHIQIYVNPVFTDNDFLSDYKDLTTYDYKSEITDFSSVYQGYYSIPLQEPVYVNEGDTFAVVVHCDTDSSIACTRKNTYTSTDNESNVTVSATDTRSEGQCFYSGSGSMWKDYQDTCTFRIKAFTNPVAKPAAPVQVTMDESEITLRYDYDGTGAGETKQLKAVLSPQDAVGGLRYRSSDPKVATVSNTGLVTAVSVGTCTITASYLDGTSASCEVTVEKCYQVNISLTLDGEEWDGGTEHVITLRDEEGNSYPNHSYVVPGVYTVCDNDVETDIVLEVTDFNRYRTIQYVSVYFYNYDGSLLHTQTVEKFSTPVYNGSIPQKPEDEIYKYIFSGWDSELSSRIQEYTAVFTSEYLPQQVTITMFVDDEAVTEPVTLQSREENDPETGKPKVYDNNALVPVGSYAVYLGDNEIGYYLEVSPGTSFASEINYYTVIFENDDHTILQKKLVQKGKEAKYTFDTPTKADDGAYRYTFEQWSGDLLSITAPTTVTAVYKADALPQKATIHCSLSSNDIPTTATVEIAFRNVKDVKETYQNGSLLPIGTYAVLVNGKDTDSSFTLQAGVPYDAELQFYLVQFKDELSGQILKEEYYLEGTMPDVPKESVLEYTNDNHWRYEILGWEPAFEEVKGVQTYVFRVKAEQIVREIDVTCRLNDTLWVDTQSDEDALYPDIRVKNVSTGELYQNHSSVPAGEYEIMVDDTNLGTVLTVLQDSGLVKADFDFYTVSFADEQGNVLQSDIYLKGEMPAAQEDLFIKENNELKSYRFLGFTPAVSPVTEKITYKPTYTTMPTMFGVKNQAGQISYFPSFEEAHAYARTLDKATYVVMQDLGSLILPGGETISIDLNGHIIKGDIIVSASTDDLKNQKSELSLIDGSDEKTGVVNGNVQMGNTVAAFEKSYLYNETEITGYVIAQSIENKGYIEAVKAFTETVTNEGQIQTIEFVAKNTTLNNQSNGSISTVKKNEGTTKNEGFIGTVSENYGRIENTGILSNIVLHKGELTNTYSGLCIDQDHPHNVTFINDGKTVHSMTVYGNTAFVFPDIYMFKANYTFKGWSASSTATTTLYQTGSTSPVLTQDSVTYYAVWEPDASDQSHDNEDDEDDESDFKYNIGDRFTYKKAVYEVISSTEVAYKKNNVRNAKTLAIPEKVVISGDEIYSVTQISANACKNNRRLKKVVLPKTIKTIGNSAFQGCGSLTSITIPKKTKTIGKKAFYKCTKLKTVIVKATSLKNVGTNAFYQIAKKAVFNVPRKKYRAYKKLLRAKTKSKIVWKKS